MRIGGPFREWDELDFLAATGMLVATGGVVASFFPRLRKIQLLFPIAIGTAMMAVAAFGARYGDGDDKLSGDRGQAETPYLRGPV